MTAHVSIVMPTNRVGGLDIVFDGLRRQTYKDFELIITDDIYDYRKDVVEERAKDYGFTVKHIKPFRDSFPVNAFSHAENCGLSFADCKTVLFITDYTWLKEDCLEKHVAFHEGNKNCGYMAPHNYFQLKDVHSDFSPYIDTEGVKEIGKLYHHTNNDTDRYAEDVKSGKYSHLMWSLLNKDFDASNFEFELDPILGNADKKLGFVFGEVFYNCFHAKNDSLDFETVLKINGFSEILDGANGYQDSDFGDRCLKFGGMRAWFVDPSNVAAIINPRPIFPHGRRERMVVDNQAIWKTQLDLNYPLQNSWSIRAINDIIRSGRQDLIHTIDWKKV